MVVFMVLDSKKLCSRLKGLVFLHGCWLDSENHLWHSRPIHGAHILIIGQRYPIRVMCGGLRL